VAPSERNINTIAEVGPANPTPRGRGEGQGVRANRRQAGPTRSPRGTTFGRKGQRL